MREIREHADRCKSVTIDEVKNKLNEFQISSIGIADGYIYNTNDKSFKVIYNDINNPISVVDDVFNYVIYINPEWYLNNQKEAEELINYIAKNNDKKTLEIEDAFLINDALIDSLCSNKNLESVSLARYKENEYVLTKEDYLKFKNSSIKSVKTGAVAPELHDNFDELIHHNYDKNLIHCLSHILFLDNETTE